MTQRNYTHKESDSCVLRPPMRAMISEASAAYPAFCRLIWFSMRIRMYLV